MDWLSALKDMIVSGEGLLLLAVVYGLWWLSGRIPNLFSPKEWDWKRGLEDLCKLLLMNQEQFEKGKEEAATATIEAAKTVKENVVESLKELKNLSKKHKTFEQEGGRGALYVVAVQTYDAFRNEVLG